MKDPHTIERVALLHPRFIPQITAFIDDIEFKTGRTFLVVQGLRTFDQQTAIYNQGRTTPGKIVTHAKAGQSYHNYGLAVDICPYAVGQNTLDWNYDFTILKVMAEANGLQCGMDFPSPDEDHFENKFGLTWEEMLEKYNEKDFIEGTEFICIL